MEEYIVNKDIDSINEENIEIIIALTKERGSSKRFAV